MVRVLVVGGGVIGLTCAVRLSEAGREVELWARDLPPRVTSNVAAAIWYPYHAGPPEKAARWALLSYRRFVELARDPRTGIVMREGCELFEGPPVPPEWRTGLQGFRPAREGELCGRDSGYRVLVPVIEMPIYLEWLRSRAEAAGVRIARRELSSLDEALEASGQVVNCAGLGARELVGDERLVPVRGQVVRVERRGLERFVLDEATRSGITSVVPRSQDCVLGGTAEEGREDLEPDDEATAAILERCTRLVPELAGARVLGTAVGLRPVRDEVRLESERPRPGQLVVHDYGHGGAGVTLSWGCAEEVLERLEAEQPSPAR